MVNPNTSTPLFSVYNAHSGQSVSSSNGTYNVGDVKFNANQANSIYQDSINDVIPLNSTIRIWERIE